MDEQDVILGQMEETRSALTDKLETLEKEVTDKVLATTENVTESVETVTNAVQQTVASVKDGVQGTVTAVTDGVKQGVNAVKSLLDFPEHFTQHPLAMFTASIAVGFCVGKYRQGERRRAPSEAASSNRGRDHANGNGKHQFAEPSAPSPSLFRDFAPEIDKLKGLALGALMGVVRDLVVEAVPEHYHDSLNEIMTSVTEKLGGKPVPEADSPRREPSFAASRM